MHLHNWRHDVVAIINSDGQVKERITYDAYGRPHCFSPGDVVTKISSVSYDRPSGVLDADDVWTTGSVLWNKDLGNGSGLAIPDGSVNSNDGTTLTNLKAAGFSGGYGILSSSAVDNRRGLAGYEFDPILEGAATANTKPIYHVRHRVLASDSGKWLQKDPLGYHDSMDLYEYCGSDPEDKRDPFGLTEQARKCTAAEPVLTTGPNMAWGSMYTDYLAGLRTFWELKDDWYSWTVSASDTRFDIRAFASSTLGSYFRFGGIGASAAYTCNFSCRAPQNAAGQWTLIGAGTGGRTGYSLSSLTAVAIFPNKSASEALGDPFGTIPTITFDPEVAVNRSTIFGIKISPTDIGVATGHSADYSLGLGHWAYQCCCTRSTLADGTDDRPDGQCDRIRAARRHSGVLWILPSAIPVGPTPPGLPWYQFNPDNNFWDPSQWL